MDTQTNDGRKQYVTGVKKKYGKEAGFGMARVWVGFHRQSTRCGFGAPVIDEKGRVSTQAKLKGSPVSHSPVEKAIRTDSHTKLSDSLWRRFIGSKTC